jgi:PAS domain S-box-containing protein
MRLLDLPAEVRTLVEFFEDDERPTGLFDGHEEPVYANEAFHGLAIEAAQLRDILELCEQETSKKGWQNGSLDSLSWKSSRLKNGWFALVFKGETPQAHAITNGHTPRTSAPPPSKNGKIPHAGPDTGKHNTAEELPRGLTSGQLDWTRFDVPNLSPWIQFVRNFDWAKTGVGAMLSWPMHLRHYLLSIMDNPAPRVLMMGRDMTFIYNEACIPLFGMKHPQCLGMNASIPWAEAWDDLAPLVNGAFHGRAMHVERLPVSLKRSEFVEQTYWDFTMLPVVNPDGYAAGVLSELGETTKIVRAEGRRNAVVKLTTRIQSATTLKQLWWNLLAGLQDNEGDACCAKLYSVEQDVQDDSGRPNPRFHLEGCVGFISDDESTIKTFKLLDNLEMGPDVNTCSEVWETKCPVILSTKDGTLPGYTTPSYEPIRTVVVKPILSRSTKDVLAILFIGLNPRCPFDEEYSLWARLITDIAESAASVILLPEEKRRAQKIADDINAALAQQLRNTTLEAERSETRLRRMAESAPTGIFMFDAEGHTIHVNDAYLEMLGDSREQHAHRMPIYKTWLDRIHPDDFDHFVSAWKGIREHKSPITIEYRLNRPWKSVDKASGQEVTGETWLLANAYPEIEPDGTVTSVQGWLTDISHRKFTENLLAQRLEEALENKRQTENFIDMTSHEMRNPLSAILQSADSIVATLKAEGTPILHESMTLSHDTVDEIVDAAQTIILCAQHQKRITVSVTGQRKAAVLGPHYVYVLFAPSSSHSAHRSFPRGFAHSRG